jgi:hypothetical protein
MSDRHDKQSFSENGTITLTSTEGAWSGDACAIQCITATVFATLTDKAERSGGASSVGQTYPAGFVLYGQFTAIDLTSGSVRVTYASPIA